MLVGLAGSSPAAAAPVQDPLATTTAPPLVTDTTAVAPTTTVASTSSTSAARQPRVADTTQIDQENRKLALVVAGLVAVALALLVLTIRYWRITKPVVDDDFDDEYDEYDDWDDEDLDDDDERDRAVAVAASPRRAVVDDLDDDEIFVMSPAAPPADDAAPEPVEPLPRRGDRRSRRSIAGADHADADAGWEPMATGEQERVSGQVPRATNRPSRSQRAGAYEASDQG